MKVVKSRLHVLMGEKRIKSISELSRLTGLSRPTLTRIYNDESDRIEFTTIIKLCEFFNCDVKDLLYLEDE